MFKLLQKIIGVKQLSVLAKINVNNINDICYSDRFGFFFIANQCLGLINNSGNILYPLLGKENEIGYKTGLSENSLLNNPTSICLKSDNEILILEDYGKLVRTVNIKNNYNNVSNISDVNRKKIDKLLPRNYNNGNTSICYSSGNIVWTNSLFNLILLLKKDGKLISIGDGSEGYNISNKFCGFKFNGVNGLSMINNNLYISDTNNHCIRNINIENITHDVPIGHPIKSNMSPKKMIVVNENIVFQDNSGIESYSKGGKLHNSVYISNSIVSITNGPQNRLTILEKENA